MNPEALPTSLSDLLLPEARADRADAPAGDRASSRADIERFERYLVSARRTVGGDQPLPAPARRNDLGPDRGEVRSEPPARPRSERPRGLDDERRPVEDRPRSTQPDDRTIDHDRRADPSAADQRAGDATTVDDDRSAVEGEATDDGEATATAPGTERAATSETDGADGAEAADETAEIAPTIELVDPGATLSIGDDPSAEVDPAAAVVDGEVDAIGLDPLEEAEVADTTDGEGSDTGPDPSAQASQLDRSLDPAAAAATAAARPAATGGPNDGETIASDATDGDGGDPAISSSTDATTAPEAAAAADDGAVDHGGTAEPGPDQDAADAADPETVEATADVVDGSEPSAEDGPDVAPVVARATSSTTPARAANGPSNAGVDAIAAPGTARSRTTTTTTAPAAGADGPVFDGDPADPLWLQVRRAIGSLRTLQSGEQQLTIRLRPAELGSVVVRVAAGDQGTTVSLLADSAVAATQLTQQRQQLISELEQGGLTGVAVDVGTDGDPNLGDANRPDDGTNSNSGGQGDGTAAAAAATGAASSGAARNGGRGRRPAGSSGGLVDVEL